MSFPDSLSSHAPEARSSAAPRASLGRWIALAVLVGLALRAWEGFTKSLWLDELHTLHHASQPSLGAVAGSVRGEVHSPLFFQAVHLLGGWEQGEALRALTVLTSLFVLVPVVAFARCSRQGWKAAALAAFLVACLPYQIHYGAMLRPYAWVGILSGLAAWAAFAEGGSRTLRFLGFFAVVLLGMFTHRIMALTVLSIGIVRLIVKSPGMLPLPWLVASGTLAVAPSLRWLVGFAEQRTADRLDYHEETGGYELRTALAKELAVLPLRVFVPYVDALRGWAAKLAFAGTLLFFGALAFSLEACAGRLRRWLGELSAPMRALMLFALVDFALTTAVAWWVWDRVPMQYYAPIAWALPVLVAECALAGARLVPGSKLLRPLAVPRRLAPGAIAAAGLLLGIAQVRGHCTEDVRESVRKAREAGAEAERLTGRKPIYTALLNQPDAFIHSLPYLAYGRDLDYREPDLVPKSGQAEFDRPVILIRRDYYEAKYWDDLERGRELMKWQIDWYIDVFCFLPRKPVGAMAGESGSYRPPAEDAGGLELAGER